MYSHHYHGMHGNTAAAAILTFYQQLYLKKIKKIILRSEIVCHQLSTIIVDWMLIIRSEKYHQLSSITAHVEPTMIQRRTPMKNWPLSRMHSSTSRRRSISQVAARTTNESFKGKQRDLKNEIGKYSIRTWREQLFITYIDSMQQLTIKPSIEWLLNYFQKSKWKQWRTGM